MAVQSSLNPHESEQTIPYGPLAQVQSAISIKDYIRSAIEHFIGKKIILEVEKTPWLVGCEDITLENRITITVEDNIWEAFERRGGEKASPTLRGFIVGRHRNGGGWAAIAEEDLASTLQIVGHEIGHLYSNPLPRILDEEAKAYAFMTGFVDSVVDFNIGGVGEAIRGFSERDGDIHRKAFDFVTDLYNKGIPPIHIYRGLAKQKLHVPNTAGYFS